MLVKVRRNGSILLKFDGEYTQFPVKVVVEADGLRELARRLKKFGSVLAICYVYSDEKGTFLPAKLHSYHPYSIEEEKNEKNVEFLDIHFTKSLLYLDREIYRKFLEIAKEEGLL